MSLFPSAGSLGSPSVQRLTDQILWLLYLSYSFQWDRPLTVVKHCLVLPLKSISGKKKQHCHSSCVVGKRRFRKPTSLGFHLTYTQEGSHSRNNNKFKSPMKSLLAQVKWKTWLRWEARGTMKVIRAVCFLILPAGTLWSTEQHFTAC